MSARFEREQGGRDGHDRDERFADWVDGRMSPRDLDRFEAELRVNPALRQRAEEYRRTVETVQRALRAPMAKVDVADAVMARIAQAPAPTTVSASVLTPTAVWRHASRRSLWLSGAVAAAVFAMLLTLSRWEPAPEATRLAEAPAVEPAGGALQDDLAGNYHRGVGGDGEAGDRQAGDDKKAGDQQPGDKNAKGDTATQWDGAGAFRDELRAEREAMKDLAENELVDEAKRAKEKSAAPTRSPVPPAEPAVPEATRRVVDRIEDQTKAEGTAQPDATVVDVANHPAPSPVAAKAELEQSGVVDRDAVPRQQAEAAKEQMRSQVGLEVRTIETGVTTLPQVRLQQTSVAYAVPQGQPEGAQALASFFLSAQGAHDLGVAMPAATLQFHRLAAAPDRVQLARLGATAASSAEKPAASPGIPSTLTGTPDADDGEAWLVEGSGPEVYSYLARLADAGRSFGYEVVNGEVPTQDVLTLLPAATVGAESADEAAGLAKRAAEAGPKSRGTRGAPPPGDGRAKLPGASAPESAPPPADVPAGAAPKAADPQAARPRGELFGGAARAAGSATPPNPQPEPQPAPQVRVVVVIERAQGTAPSAEQKK